MLILGPSPQTIHAIRAPSLLKSSVSISFIGERMIELGLICRLNEQRRVLRWCCWRSRKQGRREGEGDAQLLFMHRHQDSQRKLSITHSTVSLHRSSIDSSSDSKEPT